MPIPQTLTKLSQSLSLIGVHQTDPTVIPDPRNIIENIQNNIIAGTVTYAQAVSDFVRSFKALGAINGLTIDQNRTNYARRGINSSTEPFVHVPGPLTTTLNINRVNLYLHDAMTAFSFTSGNIAFQTKPLIVVESTNIPENVIDGSLVKLNIGLPFTLSEANPIIYTGCWISTSSIKYDLRGSDQAVMQDVSLNVGRTINFAGLVPVVGGNTVPQVLARSIQFIPGVPQPIKTAAATLSQVLGVI